MEKEFPECGILSIKMYKCYRCRHEYEIDDIAHFIGNYQKPLCKKCWNIYVNEALNIKEVKKEK